MTYDTHTGRAARYADQEASDQAAYADEPEFPRQPKDLYVKSCAPEHTIPFTKVVSTGTQPVDLLLPQDPNRRRAVITALDEAVVLCGTKELAQDPRNASTAAGLPAAGYVLIPPGTAGGAPLVTESRGALWVAATSATAGRVSVVVEKFDEDA